MSQIRQVHMRLGIQDLYYRSVTVMQCSDSAIQSQAPASLPDIKQIQHGPGPEAKKKKKHLYQADYSKDSDVSFQELNQDPLVKTGFFSNVQNLRIPGR